MEGGLLKSEYSLYAELEVIVCRFALTEGKTGDEYIHLYGGKRSEKQVQSLLIVWCFSRRSLICSSVIYLGSSIRADICRHPPPSVPQYHLYNLATPINFPFTIVFKSARAQNTTVEHPSYALTTHLTVSSLRHFNQDTKNGPTKHAPQRNNPANPSFPASIQHRRFRMHLQAYSCAECITFKATSGTNQKVS